MKNSSPAAKSCAAFAQRLEPQKMFRLTNRNRRFIPIRAKRKAVRLALCLMLISQGLVFGSINPVAAQRRVTLTVENPQERSRPTLTAETPQVSQGAITDAEIQNSPGSFSAGSETQGTTPLDSAPVVAGDQTDPLAPPLRNM